MLPEIHVKWSGLTMKQMRNHLAVKNYRRCRMNILIFGGTTEGRELAERLAGEFSATEIPREGRITVSVATELGAEELQKIDGIDILVGRMDISAMKSALCGYDLCIDATHPYAVEATKNIRKACEEASVPYWRLLREKGAVAVGHGLIHADTRTVTGLAYAGTEIAPGHMYVGTGTDTGITCVESAAEAAAFLASREGRILLTTGAKEVGAFSGIARERLYVRILPMTESLMACERAGIPHRNVIAMYGPFSQEMNEAIFRQFQIAWLVTKDAGAAGGFQEKVAAARALGVRTVVIRRPVESGASLEEILREVRSLTRLRHEDPAVCT